ncbi:helix-turn-helix transcriptional regulator [Enterococcus florum]|nr:helix-turn-helix domain-containing protein [Enterococcus florum]
MTQDESAEVLGATRQAISNWKNGRSYPDIERIIHLFDLY